MKKLLSLLLTLTMLASGVIAVAAENTESGGTTTLPVVEYIDNWDFDDEATAPTNPFKALPDLVTTEDGVTAAKFDAYTKEQNVGFESSSWADTEGRYMVFDLRIKADQKTTNTMRLIDGDQIKYDGTSVIVPGFATVTLTADVWNKITFVMDISGKEVTYDDKGAVSKVSNIKPVTLVVNGARYYPTKDETVSATSRRNYIEPYTDSKDIVYMDYYKTYTTTDEAVTKLMEDRETYLVSKYENNASKYINNWDFSDGSQPTSAWQKIATFENGEAIFNTSAEKPDINGKTINPGVDTSNVTSFVDGTNKFIVLEFSLKADKQLSNYLRIWNNNDFMFKGAYIKVPGFGQIELETGKYHKIVYVVNIENAKSNTDNSVTNMKPYLMYIDGEKYKPSDIDATLALGTTHHRIWINTTDSNNTDATADIVYMDYYKTYIADAAEVEADATYLKTTTKYTPVNMIVNRDFDYKGDLSTNAQGILPVMTTADGKGVVYFNSNNALKEDGKYSNIGFYDDVKFSDMTENYVVLETGFKFGDNDAKNICLFGGMIRVVGNSKEAILRLYSDTGNYDTGIDRNVWYDVSLVLDRSTFAEDGNLKAVKLAVGDSEINLEPKNIIWKSANKNRNANTVFIENNKENIEFWLDYYKAYTVEKDAFAFGGTSKYTMQELVYDYEFDVKAGNKFNDGDRESVTLDDGTKAIKLTGYTGPNGTNAGFEIYSGDGKGTTVVETKIMIPENDGAKSYCLANIIELKAQSAQEETKEDTLSVSLYTGDRNIVKDLTFGDWHTFEVVVDNDNQRYLTLTIDGEKYDIANGFHATANDGGSTRYYVEGATDATLEQTKSHVMYIDYMKFYKINDYLATPKYTADGAETSAIEAGKTLNVSIDVNTEIKDVTEAVNVALYSGNKLVSVTKGTYNKEAAKVTADIAVPSVIENAKVKVLGWNGVNTLKPIMPADTFPKN